MKFVDKIYIISMHKHGIRRKNVYDDLLSAGYPHKKIEWVDAIDGSKLDIDKLLDENKISHKFIDPNGALTKSIYGCALSHQKAYERFLKTDDSIKTALILEDDAHITNVGLRTLVKGSRGYEMLADDVENIDWGIIIVGHIDKDIEGTQCDEALIIQHMNRYPMGYAAHSYIINKESAQKLIDNNSPIQFAADINLHCSDVEVYSTPVSHFGQKTGRYFRWETEKMMLQYEESVLYELQDFGNEYFSSTTFGDYLGGTQRYLQTANISSKIDVEKVTFEPFTNSYGDTMANWGTIYLRTKDYE